MKEAVTLSGISRESLSRLERGDFTKWSTVKKIAAGLGATQKQHLEILAAWVKLEVGEDSRKLIIEPKSEDPMSLSDKSASITAKAMTLFNELTPANQEQIIKTMERKPVLECLPPINKFWDTDKSVKKPSKPATASYSRR